MRKINDVVTYTLPGHKPSFVPIMTKREEIDQGWEVVCQVYSQNELRQVVGWLYRTMITDGYRAIDRLFDLCARREKEGSFLLCVTPFRNGPSRGAFLAGMILARKQMKRRKSRSKSRTAGR